MTYELRNIIFILLSFTACKSKYAADKYAIPTFYRQLIASYSPGDTIKFSDGKKGISTYLVTAIDSFFIDERKGFINARGYKDITISCRELTNARLGYEVYHMIILNKYPDEASATIDLRLRDFYGFDRSIPLVLHTDTIGANGLAFTNYYVFRPSNYADQKNPTSVVEILMNKSNGIIAYKYLNGVWWTKIM